MGRSRLHIGPALRTALLYAIVSAVWILFSDLALSKIGDPRLVEDLSIAKGWFFVGITSVLLFLLILRDVNRVTKAEAQLRLLFDSVNDAIYVFLLKDDGTPGKLLDANETAAKRLGYSLEELLRMSAWDIMKPEMLPQVRIASEIRLRTGSAVFESVHLTKDGGEIPVEVSSRVIRIRGIAIGVNIARDITDRIRVEEQHRNEALALESEKRRFYRETILAVTGGKFELGDPDIADEWVKDPELSLDMSSPEHLSRVRHGVMDYCQAQGVSESAAADLEIAVGEALGNALKHAGGGHVLAGVDHDKLWVAVRDHGSGIDTFALPSVALTPGFSTTSSMGLGYTLILELCDHVKLATGPDGTTVVIEKFLKPVSEVDTRIARHAAIN